MGNEASSHGGRSGGGLRRDFLAACSHDKEFMRGGKRRVVLPCHFRPPPPPPQQQEAPPAETTEAPAPTDTHDPQEATPATIGAAAPTPEAGKEEAQAEEEVTANTTSSNLPTWTEIVEILSRKITSPSELQQALEQIGREKVSCRYFAQHYNGRDEKQTEYFFGTLLPFIQSLALRLPQLFPEDQPLPVLVPHHNAEVTLTQEQCACILASTFMRTLWIKPAWFGDGTRFPDLEFDMLFATHGGPTQSVLECILHYFSRISKQMPDGKVSFRRQVMTGDQFPDWENSTVPICPIQVFDVGTIEGSTAHLHADFANEYIGGGVLGGGCVQEEILFAIKPECLVSLLICPKMEDNEVIFITGAERFSLYKGYGHRFEWGGNFDDNTPRDSQGRRDVVIVAMDAIVAGGRNQFSRRLIDRDLNKAYNAFYQPPNSDGRLPAVATGNWGCGAFGGDKSLKVLQQILAASQAGRPLQYFTFGEKYNNASLKLRIERLARTASTGMLTVGAVYKVLTAAAGKNKPDLFLLFEDLYPPPRAEELPVAPAATSSSAPALPAGHDSPAAGSESQADESQQEEKGSSMEEN